MFGSDDDIDFIPGNNSKLASLFSGSQSSEGDNSSFTFAAPKQPKRGILKEDQKGAIEAPIQQGQGSNKEPAKLSIIIVRAVHVFLLIDGKYAPQGKLGAAILGNPSLHIYQMLLYKGKQQHVTSTKLTADFKFTVQPHNYGNFYNDQGQNWSIHFEHVTDCEEFAREVALARAASQGGENKVLSLISQDISVPNESDSDNLIANEGDMLEIYYSVQIYAAGKLGRLVESNRDAAKPQRVKIRKNVWEEGLIGVSRGVKRILMLPPDIVGPWKKEVPAGTSLVVEVDTGRLKQIRMSRASIPSRASTPRLPSVADSGESAFESGADDSIRARGATISEALSNSPRTHKANLISRMARMGQATLPLKGAISCNPSDSEETGDDSSARSLKVTPSKPLKGRTTKARSVPSQPAVENKSPIPPQQVMVYQSMPAAWQQQAIVDSYNMGRTYQVVDGRTYPIPPTTTSLPMFASPSACESVGTPPATASSELSVFFSETRTHNTEVRMAVNKVGDKVDQVLGKIEAVQNRQSGSFSGGSISVGGVDTSSVMVSIQKMIMENELLKSELDDKRNKLEVQNDRIYQLLNNSHKYIEQSSSSSSQDTVIAALKAEKAKLTVELVDVKEKANGLLLKQEQSQNSCEKQIIEMKYTIKKLLADVDGKKDNESHLETIKALQKSLSEMQSAKEAVESQLSSAKDSLEAFTKETELRVSNLTEKYSSQICLLETQGELIKKQLETVKIKAEPMNDTLIATKVRHVMNAVWKALQPQFVNGTDYEGETIRKTLMTTIRDVTNQFVNTNTASPAKEAQSIAAPKKEGKAAVGPTKEVKTDPPLTKDVKTASSPTNDRKTNASPAKEVKANSPPPASPPNKVKTASPPAKEVKVIPPASHPSKEVKTSSPPAKEVKVTPASPPSKDVKTASPPAKEIKTASPPPTEVKTAFPAAEDVKNNGQLQDLAVKPAGVEKPKAAERKLPPVEGTAGQAKPVAMQKLGEVSTLKKEEEHKESDIPSKQRTMSASKSMPVAQTTPKPSPKQSPNPSPKVTPQPVRKANEASRIKTQTKVAVEAKGNDVPNQGVEAKKEIPVTKTEEAEGWRPQPPPLFDDDDDDNAWLA